MNSFLRKPQSVLPRRVLFQVHLWLGIATGLYIFVVCVTGSALVFRIDMQRAMHPHLFTPSPGTPAEAATIMDAVRAAFPDDRLSGIDAPTTVRPTYLAYVTRGSRFLTILVDPVTGTVLGELPERSLIRTLQDLHFDLLGGRTGRIVNGIGAGVRGASSWTLPGHSNPVTSSRASSCRRPIARRFTCSSRTCDRRRSAPPIWRPSVYLDQFSGRVLQEPPKSGRTAGDVVMAWVAPLHVGNFGGLGIRIAWAALGLAPPLLFVTGFIMWWLRVVRVRWLAGHRSDIARAEEA